MDRVTKQVCDVILSYHWLIMMFGLIIQKLKDWHRQRIELFYSEGLRLFACETIPVQVVLFRSSEWSVVTIIVFVIS